MTKPELFSYDFDGTLTTGRFNPDPKSSIILTGRCIDECHIVYKKCKELNLPDLPIFFNPLILEMRGDYCEEARIKSAYHKVKVLNDLSEIYNVTHFEDDPIQISIISSMCKMVCIVTVPSSGNYYGDS